MFSDWTKEQRNVVLASFLGWTLDAFDFFLLVFVLKTIASEFATDVEAVTLAITLTLAMRPVGAFIFGRLADHFGRRPTLMVNILIYSAIEFASGFSPNLTVFIILRAIYGIAMGGEWGVGASLALETVPVASRGFVSGLLQAGYPAGYLLASVVFGLLFDHIGWRGMFMVGALPALLVVYIRSKVPESPAWTKRQASSAPKPSILAILTSQWKLCLYAIILMTAFNFFSHGTQDIYPTHLEQLFTTAGLAPGQHDPVAVHTVSVIVIIYNIGAMLGGILFGMFSSRIGRRYAILIASLLSLPVLYLWAFSVTPVMIAIGAFLMQFMVQGAWGVVPVHLNELSPDEIRGTFPGVMYQLGNLFASYNATFQAGVAKGRFSWLPNLFGVTPGTPDHPNYGFALALVAGVVAVVIAVFVAFGPERRNVAFGIPDAGADSADGKLAGLT